MDDEEMKEIKRLFKVLAAKFGERDAALFILLSSLRCSEQLRRMAKICAPDGAEE